MQTISLRIKPTEGEVKTGDRVRERQRDRKVKVKVAQLCLTVCDPMDCMEFCRPEYWSGQPFPSPGDLPNPGMEPRSPTLQADSVPVEPPGKPKNTGVGSLSLLQRIFPTQKLNRGPLHCRQILYQLSYWGSPRETERNRKELMELAKYIQLSPLSLFAFCLIQFQLDFLYDKILVNGTSKMCFDDERRRTNSTLFVSLVIIKILHSSNIQNLRKGS